MTWPQILSEESFKRFINAQDYYIEDKVCVVGIIGKGKIGHQSKAFYTNAMIEKNIFKSDFISDKREDILDDSQCAVEMFHDVEQRIIYLHLVSVFDTGRLVHLAESMTKTLSASENHKAWRSYEHKHARALLFIFSVCHLAVVVHPTQTFDVSYIKLFRTLAVARHRMLSSVTQLLSSIEDIPDIWRQTGRPCIPRILFSFQQNPGSMHDTEPLENRDSYANRARGRTQVTNPLKKTQRALEDQIYSIMKKARLLGSLSSSSLFTVSTGHEFVQIQPYATTCDPVHILLNAIAKPSINTNWATSSTLLKGRSPKVKSLLSSSNDNASQVGCAEPKPQDSILFKDFLREHIDHLMTGEGRDGLAEGRRGTHVEVPTCRLWSKVCLVLFEFFLGSKGDNNTQMHTLSDQLDLDTKFSEGRCRKVMPLATSAYRENLPSHYTHSLHLAQLSKALRTFAMHARGPSFDYFAEKLQDECNKIWLNGRQLCEERSLTGRQCVYAYHRVPESGDYIEDSEKSSSSMSAFKPHSSRITSICACNCGRTEDQRDDPFTIKAANYDFYKSLEEKCCGNLTFFTFPTHPIVLADKVPTSPTNKELKNLTENLGGLALENPSEEAEDAGLGPSKSTSVIHLRDGKEIISGHGNSLSSSAVFSHQSVTELPSHEVKSTTSSVSGDVFAAGLSCGLDEDRDSPSPRQHETDTPCKRNYLDTMLTLSTPAGLLPRLSSWSLCRIGSSSLYQPSKGLDQPGFFPGSNFLLAWDIPVLEESHSGMSSYCDGQVKLPGSKGASSEAWPTLNEVPSAITSSTLPLFSAISYAHQQCTEYITIAPPVVAPVSSKTSQSTSRGQRRSARDNSSGFTLRVWVGDEYECPRGHRFICSGPDKMVKSSSSGQVKETAHKLITSHMPLYFPCPCRSSKPFMAQLTRVFISTPDSPFLIKLNPCVQPAAPPCPIFYPGVRSGITLPPGSLCVLRFPYVYVGEHGPILPPSDAQPLLNCRLLRGMFSIMQHKNEEVREERVATKP